MVDVKRRTLPVDTERVAKELAEGSDQAYIPPSRRAGHFDLVVSSPSRGFHWAVGRTRAVITCKNGNALVVIVAHHSEYLVCVVRDQMGPAALLAKYPTELEAKKAAEREAIKIGTDRLAIAGTWRDKPATARQRGMLRRLGISHDASITKGNATDKISLGFAATVIPEAVMRRSL